jgi:hypothetical protein
MDASNSMTRGSGATSSSAGNSFRTTGFQNNGISTSNTDYFQITLSANSGTMSLSSISAKLAGTATFAASPGVSSQFAYSLDGSTFTLINAPVVTIGSPATLSVDLSGVADLQFVAASVTVTIRYYASGQTTTGGWGFNSPSASSTDDGLSIFGSIVLPVTLKFFTAISSNNQSLLSFTTATEKNNDYFAIERSSDGRVFTQIGAIKGAGTTLTPQDYTYTDEKPLRGINFYRLKQVDFDGQFSYSPVVSVVFGKVGNVVLYPTPTTSTMNVRLEEAFQTEANWQVIDLMGRIITTGIFPAEQTDLQIPVGTLSEGNYVLRVTAGQEVITQKFRKIEQ